MTPRSVLPKKSAARRRFFAPDFTAMSALGLMLINFFMVQEMWNKPQVLPVVEPGYSWCNREDATPCIDALKLICGPDKVYFYSGVTEPRLDSTDYSARGLRRLLLDMKRQIDERYGPREYTDPRNGDTIRTSYMQVIIKPMPNSRYVNFVDVIDEMRICDIRYYWVQNIYPEELEWVRRPEAGLHFSWDE
ncbi:MAG TPA: hypothetical protein PKL15_09490 [Saprospiraceae bacterium]|nr:hypothetical protein [Saprospiraceae bacterium]